jgi:hypothetical protein
VLDDIYSYYIYAKYIIYLWSTSSFEAKGERDVRKNRRRVRERRKSRKKGQVSPACPSEECETKRSGWSEITTSRQQTWNHHFLINGEMHTLKDCYGI